MIKKYTLNRDVTVDECNWLDRDFKKGETVYQFLGMTYGCISFIGIACTLDEMGAGQFFELPVGALD